MFDAAERLKETLELVTRESSLVMIIDDGSNVQCKVVWKAEHIEVTASLIDSRSTLVLLGCLR